jgi:hypothetical protein
MLRNRNLTQNRLKERLKYNQSTGKFIWLSSQYHPGLIGTTAGSSDAHGYRIIYVDGIPYKAHRLAFLYVLGRWPRRGVDHKNEIKGDNRWRNLREATPAQNNHHRGAGRSNSSGFKGVDFFKAQGKWRARIASHGVKHHLGYYATPAEAARVYDAMAITLHGEFAVLNFPVDP